MALANLSSRRLRLLIGTDSQDWSLSLGAATLGYDAVDESGLIRISGEIDLQPNAANPESLDPSENPARWRPGQPIRLQIERNTGTFVEHPCGYLFLLREPQVPRQGAGITLDVGCWLTWMDQEGVDGDQSGVTFGTSTNTAAVAQALLEADDVPAANISLGSWPYSIAVPIAKDGGSYTGLAGELAFSNDFRYLYVDKAGVVRSRQLTFATGTPVAAITLGENDSDYEPLSNQNAPAEKYKASGVGREISPLANNQVEANDETFDLSTVQPGGSGTATTTTTTTESYVFNPPTAVSRTFQTEVRTVPEKAGFEDASGIIGNPTAVQRTEVRTYDPSSAPYRLTQITDTIEKPQGVINRQETNQRTQLRDVTETIITFSYGADDTISQIVERQDDLEILHDESSSNPYNPQTVRRTTQKWVPRGNGEFKYNRSENIAAIVANSGTDTTSINPWALTIRSPNTPGVGRQGENAPPATEYWEGPFIESEQHHSGEATFTHPGGSSGRTRTVPVDVPFGFSDSQCQTIAEKKRDLAVGEYRGYLIKLPITDALIDTDFPLFQVDVVLPTGQTRRYLANGVSWEHTQDEAAVLCQGIWIDGGYA